MILRMKNLDDFFGGTQQYDKESNEFSSMDLTGPLEKTLQVYQVYIQTILDESISSMPKNSNVQHMKVYHHVSKL